MPSGRFIEVKFGFCEIKTTSRVENSRCCIGHERWFAGRKLSPTGRQTCKRSLLNYCKNVDGEVRILQFKLDNVVIN